MRVACLTGGGDCPGLNAVIRGLVRTIHNNGGETLGLLEGWRGAVEGNHIVLDPMQTDEVLHEGGTILGSSRTNPYKDEETVQRVVDTFHKLKLDALVAIGGDDTLGVASKLYADHGLPTIGCPKTIDNDLSSTDFTFGFDTCLNTVMDAVDKLRTTAESHRRIMVVEVMGRHAGWITCFSGIANAADAIMVPEEEVDMDMICDRLKKRRESGKTYGIVMVSDLGGIGTRVAKIIEKNTGIETRDVTLGHLQRGGSPSAYDRVLGTRLGIHAGRLAMKKDFGKMVALRGLHIVAVPLAEAVGTMR
ncbi:UNVERIFIED_CONTAM: hypothetical protein GTU68_064968, partial [Idotea baltica]|nr:hypothetical protein [Idotea baltica]